MEMNWIVGVYAGLMLVCAILIVGDLMALSNALCEIRTEMRTGVRTLGQIGNFLWPQHTLAKQTLKRQDNAEKELAEWKARLNKEADLNNKPATVRQVGDLTSIAEDVRETLNNLIKDNQVDLDAIDEFRTRLGNIEQTLRGMSQPAGAAPAQPPDCGDSSA